MPAQSEPYDAPAIVTFAKELEWQRTKAGLSKKELAATLGFAESYVGQVELCKNLPSEDFADALDIYFKTDGLFRRLRERIIETRHVSHLPPGFREYQGHEQRADSIKKFSALLLSGLFQTERYARTIIESIEGADIDALVSQRMERQAIFSRNPPPRVWLTVDEMVLRRMVGCADVMREQLAFLLEVSERPRTMVEVIPFDAGYHAGLGGSLTILGFDDGHDIGYVESSGVGVVVEQPAGVAALHVRYDLLRGHALPVEESRALIRTVMEDL
jgi:transcriptional regulator with XRE-family HTH domain